MIPKCFVCCLVMYYFLTVIPNLGLCQSELTEESPLETADLDKLADLVNAINDETTGIQNDMNWTINEEELDERTANEFDITMDDDPSAGETESIEKMFEKYDNRLKNESWFQYQNPEADAARIISDDDAIATDVLDTINGIVNQFQTSSVDTVEKEDEFVRMLSNGEENVEALRRQHDELIAGIMKDNDNGNDDKSTNSAQDVVRMMEDEKELDESLKEIEKIVDSEVREEFIKDIPAPQDNTDVRQEIQGPEISEPLEYKIDIPIIAFPVETIYLAVTEDNARSASVDTSSSTYQADAIETARMDEIEPITTFSIVESTGIESFKSALDENATEEVVATTEVNFVDEIATDKIVTKTKSEYVELTTEGVLDTTITTATTIDEYIPGDKLRAYNPSVASFETITTYIPTESDQNNVENTTDPVENIDDTRSNILITTTIDPYLKDINFTPVTSDNAEELEMMLERDLNYYAGGDLSLTPGHLINEQVARIESEMLYNQNSLSELERDTEFSTTEVLTESVAKAVETNNENKFEQTADENPPNGTTDENYTKPSIVEISHYTTINNRYEATTLSSLHEVVPTETFSTYTHLPLSSSTTNISPTEYHVTPNYHYRDSTTNSYQNSVNVLSSTTRDSSSSEESIEERQAPTKKRIIDHKTKYLAVIDFLLGKTKHLHTPPIEKIDIRSKLPSTISHAERTKLTERMKEQILDLVLSKLKEQNYRLFDNELVDDIDDDPHNIIKKGGANPRFLSGDVEIILPDQITTESAPELVLTTQQTVMSQNENETPTDSVSLPELFVVEDPEINNTASYALRTLVDAVELSTEITQASEFFRGLSEKMPPTLETDNHIVSSKNTRDMVDHGVETDHDIDNKSQPKVHQAALTDYTTNNIILFSITVAVSAAIIVLIIVAINRTKHLIDLDLVPV